jgi:hypothetical protein
MTSNMNATTKGGLTAILLTAAIAPARAASYSTPQPPVVNRQTPQRTAKVQISRNNYVSQQSMFPGANDNVGIVQMPTRKTGPIQGGNTLNWLGGGGG